MIELEHTNGVYTLTMDADENRWNTTFVRAFDAALDEVAASTGPAALITTASSTKFFSNGLDLAWVQRPDEHPQGGPRDVFGDEFMKLMSRLITFPLPTIAAVNGHAFGAGFMCALCHDVRIMRADRGFLCANEMQLGLRIPKPELALFKHKLSAQAFFETVQLAKRWTAASALQAGVVSHTAELSELSDQAMTVADGLKPLGGNRELYGGQKETLFGEHAVLNEPHGAAYLLRNLDLYS